MVGPDWFMTPPHLSSTPTRSSIQRSQDAVARGQIETAHRALDLSTAHHIVGPPGRLATGSGPHVLGLVMPARWPQGNCATAFGLHRCAGTRGCTAARSACPERRPTGRLAHHAASPLSRAPSSGHSRWAGGIAHVATSGRSDACIARRLAIFSWSSSSFWAATFRAAWQMAGPPTCCIDS